MFQTAGDSQARAAEIHTIKTAGAGAEYVCAADFTMQTNVVSVGSTQQDGINIMNLPTAWAVSGGLRADVGVRIGLDEKGFKYGWRYIATSAESNVELGSLDQDGTLRIAKNLYVTGTSNTYDIGTNVGLFRAIYGGVHISGNGSASAPAFAGNSFLTSGLYFPGSNAAALASNGVRRMLFDSAGNVVIGNDVLLATNATDGFLRIPAMNGAPSGVPTSYTGTVSIVFNASDNKIHVYDGGWLATAALT
jgi:hypothetical protein